MQEQLVPLPLSFFLYFLEKPFLHHPPKTHRRLQESPLQTAVFYFILFGIVSRRPEHFFAIQTTIVVSTASLMIFSFTHAPQKLIFLSVK